MTGVQTCALPIYLARQEIENLLGSSVYLDIWVKVKRDWRNKSGALSELGYKNE